MTDSANETRWPPFELRQSDPAKYLELINQILKQDPGNADAYYMRSATWEHLGRDDLALEDLNTSLSLEQHWLSYKERGNLFRKLSDYHPALDDFNRCEKLEPEGFSVCFGLLYRADCHARLGNEQAALADCTRLPEDHWTPGLRDAPAGNKKDVVARVRWLAALARQQQRK